MSAEKTRDFGTAFFVTALLLLLAFFVGNVIGAPKRPMRFLEKYEKLCAEKNTEKIAKMYAKSENMNSGNVTIPFEGLNAEFLFEDMQQVADKTYCITYTAYYEMQGNDNFGKKTKTVMNPYTYSDNKIYVKKSLFGYKMLNYQEATE